MVVGEGEGKIKRQRQGIRAGSERCNGSPRRGVTRGRLGLGRAGGRLGLGAGLGLRLGLKISHPTPTRLIEIRFIKVGFSLIKSGQGGLGMIFFVIPKTGMDGCNRIHHIWQRIFFFAFLSSRLRNKSHKTRFHIIGISHYELSTGNLLSHFVHVFLFQAFEVEYGAACILV